jgi:hypothetical protein
VDAREQLAASRARIVKNFEGNSEGWSFELGELADYAPWVRV